MTKLGARGQGPGASLVVIIAAAVVALAGCGEQRNPPLQVWPDMRVQEKFKPQGQTKELFAEDHRHARPTPAGTVARGHMAEDTPYFTGMEGANFTGKNPVAVTLDLLKHGQGKFNTYCSPCHDRAGTGAGIVPQRVPAWQPANLMADRVVQFNDGEIFHIVSNGRASMPSYRAQISVEDRWAIIAYLRALQRASLGKVADVPAEMRSELK